MTQDEVKENLLSSTQWLRMLIMAGFLLAVWVLGMVLLVVMITQTLTVLITGEANLNLQRFGALCAAYLYQIVNYLVYGTDEKPFPFASFPDVYDSEAVQQAAAPSASTYASSPVPADSDFDDMAAPDEDLPWTDETVPDPYDDPDPDADGPGRS